MVWNRKLGKADQRKGRCPPLDQRGCAARLVTPPNQIFSFRITVLLGPLDGEVCEDHLVFLENTVMWLLTGGLVGEVSEPWMSLSTTGFGWCTRKSLIVLGILKKDSVYRESLFLPIPF